MQHLRNLDFPQVVHAGLEKIVECFAASSSSQAVQRHTSEELAERIVSEIIYGLRNRGGGNFVRRYTAVQELHVVQILLQFFNDGSNSSRFPVTGNELRHRLFAALVAPSVEPKACQSMIYKLISLAITTACSNVLDVGAVWMLIQREEGEIEMTTSEKITMQLVSEYCDPSFVDGGKSLREIPNISERFASSFLYAVTNVFSLHDQTGDKPEVPGELFKIITDWLMERPSLCLIGHWLAKDDQSSFSSLWGRERDVGGTLGRGSPLPGLMSWTCTAALLEAQRMNSSSNSTSIEEKSSKQSLAPLVVAKEPMAYDWSAQWPVLQVAVLHGLMSYNGDSALHDKPKPISVVDVSHVISNLTALSHQQGGDVVGDSTPLIQASEVLLQIVTVAASRGAFTCSPEEWDYVIQSLPYCRFLDILQRNSSELFKSFTQKT